MSEHQDLLSEVRGSSLSEVMHSPVPGFLFDQCFRDRSITVLVAPPHRGKTFLMLDMFLCLDMEIPLLGRFAPLPGRSSFFLGCDAPEWDYGLQARKLCIGHGLSPGQRDLLELPGIWRAGVRLTDPDFRDWLGRWKKSTSADVLFIDTHRSTHGANENDSGEMERVWDILKTLRDRGWCIIMAHHVSKPSDVLQEDVHGLRGSTVIGASADFIYTLNKRTRKDQRVRVSCIKGRGAADGDDPFTHFDIVSVPAPPGEILNGQPLNGVRLVATVEDPKLAVVARLTEGPSDRKDLCARVVSACPSLLKKRPEEVYKIVDGILLELRTEGRAHAIERGVWALKEES